MVGLRKAVVAETDTPAAVGLEPNISSSKGDGVASDRCSFGLFFCQNHFTEIKSSLIR
ncbi:hypothetical protein CHELA20_52664 [Hyphomicrobiales bacterium]|nr:hypothetical protein CHELA41_22264 [Hyphomicrobiales bacterium]CAH1682550.1 hypothetical protein CHELA20_52664 [Hyphomicrobiales bacterium]